MKGATAPIRAVVTQNNCQHTIGKQFNSSALHPPAHRSQYILKQTEDGKTVEKVCRMAGISIQTYYRWRSKYGGLMHSEMKRAKAA